MAKRVLFFLKIPCLALKLQEKNQALKELGGQRLCFATFSARGFMGPNPLFVGSITYISRLGCRKIEHYAAPL